ncbi:hypothetical protein [Sphingobacterium lactis]|uniref:hypothetical protein n=1 Tax=Sphingobacterium lactis TaxID=797291 RepID=UPI003DA6CB30
MLQVIKKLESLNRINNKAEKYTHVTDDKAVVQGVLFFVPLEKFEVKILIPAPFHESLFQNGNPTFKQLLNHKEAMMLK